MLVFFMTAIIITALPQIRKRVFEVFYYFHLVCCVAMVFSAFFHTGYLVPCLAVLSWGEDLIFRRFFMPKLWYPTEAKLRIISDSVVEVSFPKTAEFAFNPGQYICICIPEITMWQWHPFR